MTSIRRGAGGRLAVSEEEVQAGRDDYADGVLHTIKEEVVDLAKYVGNARD